MVQICYTRPVVHTTIGRKVVQHEFNLWTTIYAEALVHEEE